MKMFIKNVCYERLHDYLIPQMQVQKALDFGFWLFKKTEENPRIIIGHFLKIGMEVVSKHFF